MKSLFSRLTVYDLILILFLFVTSLIFITAGIYRSTGNTAEVFIGNEVIDRLDLSDDGIYTYDAFQGKITISIHDGKVKVSESSCPLKLCMKMGSAFRKGDIIVCLPNKFMVVVQSGENSSVHGVTG